MGGPRSSPVFWRYIQTPWLGCIPTNPHPYKCAPPNKAFFQPHQTSAHPSLPEFTAKISARVRSYYKKGVMFRVDSPLLGLGRPHCLGVGPPLPAVPCPPGRPRAGSPWTSAWCGTTKPTARRLAARLAWIGSRIGPHVCKSRHPAGRGGGEAINEGGGSPRIPAPNFLARSWLANSLPPCWRQSFPVGLRSGRSLGRGAGKPHLENLNAHFLKEGRLSPEDAIQPGPPGDGSGRGGRGCFAGGYPLFWISQLRGFR